jgi:cytochrome c oxidase cbb3-type subunit 3
MRRAAVLLRAAALPWILAALATGMVAGLRAQGGRQGGAGGNPNATFPAQQRELADPALIDRGRGIYEVSCRACHGPDLRGGDLGGPNLLRSPVVLNDEGGELITSVIQNGQATAGSQPMPPIGLSDEDSRAVAEYLRSVLATARGQGAPPAGAEAELDVLVGDAVAGEAYFAARCGTCHSATGDLQGIGARMPDAKELQNAWVRGRAGRGFGPPSERSQTRVTVTRLAGERVEGTLVRLDDFLVVLTRADGRQVSFARRGDVPQVEIDDPMQGHTDLLPVYTDADIHNVTAYLATLR